MAQPGLRILSLDGGGTRCLSMLYILRTILENLAPNGANWQDIRPCEFFDLIGGSGPGGLLAIVLARFCFTIQEAIDFMHGLAERLDDVEEFRLKVLSGGQDESWEQYAIKFNTSFEQVEALRQGIVQDSWSTLIKAKIADVLERHPYTQGGVFDHKLPTASIGPARSKAFVVGSESRGYGEDGGTDDARQYHVPIQHRLYQCRHGKTLYTLHALGLATIASPNIVKPGIVLPNLTATGRHTTHNPVQLLIEECRKLWPGLQIGTLLSIGTGPFSVPVEAGPNASSTARACQIIWEENKKITNEFRRFIVPHDKNLAQACYRFELDGESPFFEFSARNRITDQVRSMFESPSGTTKLTRVVSALKHDDFPTTAEDQLLISALASLLQTLVDSAYVHEAELIADVISNYILYEGAGITTEAWRKVQTAAIISKISRVVCDLRARYDQQPVNDRAEEPTMSSVLNDLVTYIERGSTNNLDADTLNKGPAKLENATDIAIGAFYCMNILRRGDRSMMQQRFRHIQNQLSLVLGISISTTHAFSGQMEPLLKLATLASLCEVGTIETLKGYKRLLLNGPFIRYLHKTLAELPLEGISATILGPIANAVALSIHIDNWSTFRDDSIFNILQAFLSNAYYTDSPWSFVNLALEYIKLTQRMSLPPTNRVLRASNEIINRFSRQYDSSRPFIAMECVKHGYFALLRRCLRDENLSDIGRFENAKPSNSTPQMMESAIDGDGNTLLHLASKLGYPWIMKIVLESLGLATGKIWVNRPNGKGQTAIHLACMNRSPKEVFALLNFLGADTNQQCQSGKTPLHYCFPDQKHLPPIHDRLLKIIEDQELPTILPLNPTKQMGPYGRGRDMDPRSFGFRVIISHLISRGADFTVQDQEGRTPVHLASQGGWGDNIDVFFIVADGDAAQKLQTACLTIQDFAGATLLDHARMTGTKGRLDGGEEVILAEMRKRDLHISQDPVELIKGRYRSMRASQMKSNNTELADFNYVAHKRSRSSVRPTTSAVQQHHVKPVETLPPPPSSNALRPERSSSLAPARPQVHQTSVPALSNNPTNRNPPSLLPIAESTLNFDLPLPSTRDQIRHRSGSAGLSSHPTESSENLHNQSPVTRPQAQVVHSNPSKTQLNYLGALESSLNTLIDSKSTTPTNSPHRPSASAHFRFDTVSSTPEPDQSHRRSVSSPLLNLMNNKPTVLEKPSSSELTSKPNLVQKPSTSDLSDAIRSYPSPPASRASSKLGHAPKTFNTGSTTANKPVFGSGLVPTTHQDLTVGRATPPPSNTSSPSRTSHHRGGSGFQAGLKPTTDIAELRAAAQKSRTVQPLPTPSPSPPTPQNNTSRNTSTKKGFFSGFSKTSKARKGSTSKASHSRNPSFFNPQPAPIPTQNPSQTSLVIRPSPSPSPPPQIQPFQKDFTSNILGSTTSLNSTLRLPSPSIASPSPVAEPSPPPSPTSHQPSTFQRGTYVPKGPIGVPPSSNPPPSQLALSSGPSPAAQSEPQKQSQPQPQTFRRPTQTRPPSNTPFGHSSNLSQTPMTPSPLSVNAPITAGDHDDKDTEEEKYPRKHSFSSQFRPSSLGGSKNVSRTNSISSLRSGYASLGYAIPPSRVQSFNAQYTQHQIERQQQQQEKEKEKERQEKEKQMKRPQSRSRLVIKFMSRS